MHIQCKPTTTTFTFQLQYEYCFVLTIKLINMVVTDPPSVYGGAGGYGTRVSTSINYGQVFGGNFQLNIGGNDVLLTGNEKSAMQNLNDRLASYLEKVHSLEKRNSLLEKQIKEWHEKNTTVTRYDYSSYFKTTEDLQKKIGAAQLENARLALQIDNARLAADDFRLKYENEYLLRQSVKSDINGLLRVYDDLTLIKSDLESQIESVNEELVFLKKNHEEVRAVSSPVNVEVDAAPSTDLAAIMENMRRQYEEMAEKNRQEAKERFEKQTEELNQKVAIDTEQLQGQRREITNRKQIFQGLKLELQTQLNMKKPLEDTLAETEAQYRYQLTQIQEAVVNLEAQLRQLRADMEGQNNEHSRLLDIKTRLEMEIATYRRLLEGEDTPSHTRAGTQQKHINLLLQSMASFAACTGLCSALPVSLVAKLFKNLKRSK
uniref:Keratin, type I cytoskeletal 20 n=1 Tax=Aquila chrysaetos chrysaetos TaxID=223781 RepID=A0A663DWD7_AQUCH